jgi:hypothetical protein
VGHRRHAVMSPPSETYPVEQFTGAALALAQYLPGGHKSQLVEPVLSAVVPALHAEHATAPARLKVPAGHAWGAYEAVAHW